MIIEGESEVIVEALRIRNNAVFLIKDFRDFMLKFFESDKMVKDPAGALAELAKKIHLDALGLFVTRDESGWTGAILCQHNSTAFSPACVVIHLDCKGGGAETRKLLVQSLYNFAKEGGYNEIIAIDTNDKPTGFEKLFGALGEPVVLGSVFRFDMDESLL